MSRADEMVSMRYNNKMTLQEIANVYGISRERVRQIIGNTGNGFVVSRNTDFVKAHPEMTNEEVSEAIGLCCGRVSAYRGGERHAIKGGWLGLGANIEEWVMNLLHKMDINGKLMGHFHPFDILLNNGLKLDVKSSVERQLGRVRGYSFNTDELRRGENYADFFICVLRDLDPYEVFVIPATETRGNGTPIRFKFPPGQKSSKWHQYHNRFELLK